MKKYNRIIVVIAVLVSITFNTSCSDNFLDEVEEFNIDSENFFNSEEDYNQALIGAYDVLQSTYVNVLLGEIASDNTLCGGESATDVIGFQQIDDMIHTPVNSNLQDVWSWMFAGVNRANYILEFQDKTDFEGKNIILAEAKFLRAYYHFELVKWFGGIPLKGDARFEPGDELALPRSSVEEVYALIESDLQYAVANLTYASPQAGRANRGSAEALLGKAYLYQDKFTEAATVLESLINNGPFGLVEDYNTIFENEGENGIESVFEIQYTDSEGGSFDCLQCSEGNVAVGFNGIRNYDGPDFDSGFSFNVPVQGAYDAFEDGDTRRDVAILNIDEWATATGATFGVGFEHTGYYNRKYIARDGDLNTGDANLTNPNNYRSIRFADVLLMAAEALNRGGISDSRAQIYVNRVRERAFGDADHNISVSGSNLTQAIYDERRVELVGEGHRFFDLVRTGNGILIPGFTVGKHELFPIPIEEIQFANGNWIQNNGYTN